MDPRAVKQNQLSNDEIYFIMNATKQNGEHRTRFYRKLNDALRALYRIKNIVNGTVSAKMPGFARTKPLIGRVSKDGIKSKRALYIGNVASPDGRPVVKALGKYWRQMPRKGINEIE